MPHKQEKLVRGHRRESALFTLPELQDLRGNLHINYQLAKLSSLT
jgi:hypothetical protein